MALPSTPRLAPAGQVWLPGVDYEVVDAMPLPATQADTQPCPVFRIRRRGTLYVLVVVPCLPVPSSDCSPRQTGWQILPSLPPDPSLIPVLHHYICVHPTAAPGHGALYLVLPPQGLSVAEFIAQRRASIPLPPYGLGWRWFGEVLLHVLRVVDHLSTYHVIHGHICWENFQLEPELEALGRPYLTGFHNAWLTVVDGQPVRADLRRKRVGTGSYRAPDVYRAVGAAMNGSDTARLLSKAETWTAGRCMYDLLCSPSETQFFHRIRSLDGYHYDDQALPPLPATCPQWLSYVVEGLVRCEAADRLSARDAIQMLRMSLQHPPRHIVTVVEKVVQQPVLSTGDPIPQGSAEVVVPTAPPAPVKVDWIDMQVPYNPLDLGLDRSWSAESPNHAQKSTTSESCHSFNTNSTNSAHLPLSSQGTPGNNARRLETIPIPAEDSPANLKPLRPVSPGHVPQPRGSRGRSCPPSPRREGQGRLSSQPGHRGTGLDDEHRPLGMRRSRSPEPPLNFYLTSPQSMRGRFGAQTMQMQSRSFKDRAKSPPGGNRKTKPKL
eukprot:GGOE01001389.1.p1 GENE.GGOE01001389.1~~GGOE01001389.1.p1  ORF type:complete len:550 (+),score=40.18 GGOE01001389.1:44-1693(+)